ncbi:MAG: hypothetical protein K1000chlam2_01695, partial [Chlamydiae bacterium]|nr:hypothetical protein [Chlamydiota bacterium]
MALQEQITLSNPSLVTGSTLHKVVKERRGN